jgi:hypothetical protein
MRSRGLRLRRVIAAGLAVVLLGLLGCSDPEAPAYVEVVDGKLTATRPVAWETTVEVDPPWTSGFRLTPDSIEQIQFSGDFGEYATAGEAVGTLIGQAQIKLAEFTVVETRDVEVRGATTAQVVRYTILDNANSQLSGTWIVAAHWPYPQSVAISILTPQHDPDLEREILDSMRMRPVLA